MNEGIIFGVDDIETRSYSILRDDKATYSFKCHVVVIWFSIYEVKNLYELKMVSKLEKLLFSSRVTWNIYGCFYLY